MNSSHFYAFLGIRFYIFHPSFYQNVSPHHKNFLSMTLKIMWHETWSCRLNIAWKIVESSHQPPWDQDHLILSGFPWNSRGPLSLPNSYLLGVPIGRVRSRNLRVSRVHPSITWSWLSMQSPHMDSAIHLEPLNAPGGQRMWSVGQFFLTSDLFLFGNFVAIGCPAGSDRFAIRS